MNDKDKRIGFTFAWNGIKDVIRSERNFRIHLLAFLIVLCISFSLKLSTIEWSIILLVCALVLVTEIINSAIEILTDYLFTEKHKTAKSIKDISAGAVLVSAIFAIIIGLLIFIPKIFLLLEKKPHFFDGFF